MRRERIALGILCVSVFLISCAHMEPHSQDGAIAGPTPQPPVEVAPPQDGVIGHLNEQKAIPLEVNNYVSVWLDYFQGKGRRHMEHYLARSTRYLSLMKQILKDNGVPEEMVYVAMIESGFSFQARSRAKAVGYWQFIGGTGRRYGLKMNRLVDERRDPIASTQAAAQYLKGLYNLFGQWELALAAYNVGENRVQRVITSNYTRDYWEMAKRRMLPDETLNYVPKFIAASMIAMNPEKYGFKDIEYENPFEFEVVKFTKAMNLRSLAGKFNVAYSDFKTMNPAYRTDQVPLNSDGECMIRVPKGQDASAEVALPQAAASQERVVATVEKGSDQEYFYIRIKRGDNLRKIANRYGVSQSSIRQLNGLRNNTKLRVGRRLKIPGNARMEATSNLRPQRPLSS